MLQHASPDEGTDPEKDTLFEVGSGLGHTPPELAHWSISSAVKISQYRLHVDGRPSTEVARRPEALTEAVAE